jgi:DNA modification methylase
VLDFCAGSGSYQISAIRTGHPFIAIERDEKHFRIACDRVAPLIQKDRSEAAD